MARSAAQPALDSAQIEFLRTPGLSAYVASRNAQHESGLARCFGYRISRGGRTITVLVATLQAQELLANVRANGAIAMVLTLPHTHAAMQLKGADAAITRVLPSDAALATRFKNNFVRELVPLGYSNAMVGTFMTVPEGKLSAITFTPYAVFSQTPGPSAGQAMRAAAR